MSREVRVKKSKWSVSVKTKYWLGSPLTELNGVPGWATRRRATLEPIRASSTARPPAARASPRRAPARRPPPRRGAASGGYGPRTGRANRSFVRLSCSCIAPPARSGRKRGRDDAGRRPCDSSPRSRRRPRACPASHSSAARGTTRYSARRQHRAARGCAAVCPSGEFADHEPIGPQRRQCRRHASFDLQHRQPHVCRRSGLSQVVAELLDRGSRPRHDRRTEARLGVARRARR